MRNHIERDLQRTSSGITADYFNETLRFDTIFALRGIDGVLNELQARPMLGYEERRAKMQQLYWNDHEYALRVGRMYEVTSENRDTVKKINAVVRLINGASGSGSLTAELFQELSGYIAKLRDESSPVQPPYVRFAKTPGADQ